MDEKTVRKMFHEGFACSQVCLSELSSEVGLDKNEAKKISALFGGGAGCGEMCGAVAGCLMALGMKYGNSKANDMETMNLGQNKMKEFTELFEAEFGSIVCREILGYDISIPEEMEIIQEKGFFENKCPKLVCRAIEMTREIM
jgi:C_GCAxxG_C_C family probable redox protein